jgi:hypothetical protein
MLRDFAGNFWGLIIHMSSTGNAEELSAVSHQLSVKAFVLRSVAIQQFIPAFAALQRGQECPRTRVFALHEPNLPHFFFFLGVAGEETLDEVGVGVAGAELGIGKNFAV